MKYFACFAAGLTLANYTDYFFGAHQPTLSGLLLWTVLAWLPLLLVCLWPQMDRTSRNHPPKKQ